MAITNKEIEELQQRKRELDAKLKMHEAGMRSRGIGAYQKKQKAVEKVQIEHDKIETKVLKEVLKEVKVPENDVEYELTPKAMEMASKLSESKVVNNIVSNPIASSLTNIKGEKNQSQPKQKNYKTNQPKQSTSKRNKRKDPNYSSIAPGISRPLKLNDTAGDILGKIYNFMFQKYHRDVIQLTNDAKYRKLLHKIKERRIDELIRLFGGKYKKVDPKSEKKLENGKKGFLGKIVDGVKDIINSVVGGAGKTVSTVSGTVSKASITPNVSTVAKIAVGAATVVGTKNVIAKVLEVGPGFNVVQRPDGTVEKQTGARNWRNNNPGNIEYKPGGFAEENGAIGSDGRFAIFPTYEMGRKAKEKLIFEGKNYKNLDLKSAIARYAPPTGKSGQFENDTDTYQKKVLSSVGGENRKMSDYSQSQRESIMNAMEQQEGYRTGKVETTNKTTTSPMPVSVNTKPQIPATIKPTESKNSTSVSVLNNNTNIINGSTNMAVMSSDNNSYPVLIDKQYYNYG
jgi:hypothetical protein